MGDDALIDVQQLETICSECGEEIVEIFNEFVAESPESFVRLHDLIAIGDASGIEKLTHQIKGSCATFGMVRFAHRLRDIELAAGQGTLPSVETVAEARALFDASVREIRGLHPAFGP